MDRDDEQLLRGRVYGTDRDHPGPLPHRDYAELVGGPLGGLLLDITSWTADGPDRRRALRVVAVCFCRGLRTWGCRRARAVSSVFAAMSGRACLRAPCR
ncbi:hypothetical protein [Streptomyces rishiriensis]|uniref:hypothetical protein n=1 Tax=Streptomyces rishiriensis TaxID=68264 RepID=UPI0037CEDAC6